VTDTNKARNTESCRMLFGAVASLHRDAFRAAPARDGKSVRRGKTIVIARWAIVIERLSWLVSHR
jgi:hypothetical protein